MKLPIVHLLCVTLSCGVSVRLDANGHSGPQSVIGMVVQDDVKIERRVIITAGGQESLGKVDMLSLMLRRTVDKVANPADGKERVSISYQAASLDGKQPEWSGKTFSVALPIDAASVVADEAGAPAPAEVSQLVMRDVKSLGFGEKNEQGCQAAGQRLPEADCDALAGLAVWIDGAPAVQAASAAGASATAASSRDVRIKTPFVELAGTLASKPGHYQLTLTGDGSKVSSRAKVSDEVKDPPAVFGDSFVRTAITATRTTTSAK